MRGSVLVENSGSEERKDLSPEFGLSLHIENNGQNMLFDTGASGVFVDNAEKMGIDISAVTVAILSHHHFDHGGGCTAFLVGAGSGLETGCDSRLHQRKLDSDRYSRNLPRPVRRALR